MHYFVEVIIPLSLANTFTYQISETEFNFIQPGMRIAVPFGKSKTYTALALSKHTKKPEDFDIKEIIEILDEKPKVTDIQLKHWQWIAKYYMCSIGDVYRTAIPSSLILEGETIVTLLAEISVDESTLSDHEYLVYEALQQQPSLRIDEIIAILNKRDIFPVIQSLVTKKIVGVGERIVERYKAKKTKFVRINTIFSDSQGLAALMQELSKAEKQRNAVMTYFKLAAGNTKPIKTKLLSEAGDISASVIKALVDKEVFEIYYQEEDRVIFADSTLEAPSLSEVQQKAFSEIQNSFKEKNVCLLHGVTGSGKTEIYIRLIQEYLDKGNSVLYLLPEIALTTQLVGRLVKHFGNKVAVFHSKYSNNERVEVWNQVLESSSTAQVVIGARSALFLPFKNLGFIIVDEEHEQMFKQQEPAPRYNARDAAIVLANMHKSNVLLGSATPSVESYYNTQIDKYGLVNLKERFGEVQMPKIEIVDLKDKYYRKAMKGHFSDTLLEYIQNSLDAAEQVILFQNRRGYSPVMECMTCGHVPQCRQCDVSLTYHKVHNHLRCHYCGFTIAKPLSCHNCSSPHLITKGFGTEQVQLELKELFPDAKVARMDQDTTKGKFGFDKLIDSFQNREYDILVGTQMVAKGLDFANVSLVGIMNADNMLYHPDFRAFERSYQMMVQVAGRSGRSHKQGNVIIQTYNPKHAIIGQVVESDYLAMYSDQLYDRKIYNYPPYYKLIRFTLKHKDFEKLKEGSTWLYQVLVQNLDIPVLGPEEPAINRIRNEYLRTILIKIPAHYSLDKTKTVLGKILKSFEAIAQYRSIKVVVNVDP